MERRFPNGTLSSDVRLYIPPVLSTLTHSLGGMEVIGSRIDQSPSADMAATALLHLLFTSFFIISGRPALDRAFPSNRDDGHGRTIPLRLPDLRPQDSRPSPDAATPSNPPTIAIRRQHPRQHPKRQVEGYDHIDLAHLHAGSGGDDPRRKGIMSASSVVLIFFLRHRMWESCAGAAGESVGGGTFAGWFGW